MTRTFEELKNYLEQTYPNVKWTATSSCFENKYEYVSFSDDEKGFFGYFDKIKIIYRFSGAIEKWDNQKQSFSERGLEKLYKLEKFR